MQIVDEITRLKEERRVAVESLNATKAKAQQIKDKHLNAQNETHQRRIDAEHRLVIAKCYRIQDELTKMNAQLKLLGASLHRERADARRVEG